MKKAFGIIFLLIGLVMIGLGLVALTDAESRSRSFEGRIGNTFSERYRSNTQQQQLAGFGLIGVGFILLVTGIIMVVTKSNSQRRKEAELAILKQTHEQNIIHSSKGLNVAVLTKQAVNFYNQKDYISSIAVLQRILTVDPLNNQTLFNLACAYSLTSNKDAFVILSKAIENGYNNFEKIKAYQDLEWLRSQSEYENFLKNGYKLNPSEISSNTSFKVVSGDLFNQIEKLGKLKAQGLLTDEEFQQQKKKILG
jgi:hypothetical protein